MTLLLGPVDRILAREIFRVVHSSWKASLQPCSSARDPDAMNIGDQTARLLDQSNTPNSKTRAPPVTVLEEGRKYSRIPTQCGGGGSSDRGSSVSTHTARAGSARKASVLTTGGGLAAAAVAGEKNKDSLSEGTSTGTILSIPAASRTNPVDASSITNHGALSQAQDKAMEPSTLATTPLKSVAGGQGGAEGREGGDTREGKRERGDTRLSPLNDDDKRCEKEGGGENRNPVLKAETVLSVPRSEIVQELRQSGLLRRKAMTSDALRPILCDRDFTEVSRFE